MSELWITTPGSEDEAALISLRKWLVESPEMRDVAVTSHRSTPEPGTMPGTGTVDAVVAVVTDRAVLTAAVSVLGGWVAARLSARRTRLRIKHGDREVEVDTAQARDLDDLAAWLLDMLDEDGHSAES